MAMIKDYKYRIDKKSRIITTAIIIIICAIVAIMYFYSTSGFLPTWVLIFLLTIAALYILSIPIKIRVTDRTLDIRCLVEMTTIRIEDIKSMEKIRKEDIRYIFPLIGSYGFFGYYGYYYSLAEMTTLKVYISEWKNLMRIEDIYEDVYIINCSDPDELMYLVSKAKAAAKEKP